MVGRAGAAGVGVNGGDETTKERKKGKGTSENGGGGEVYGGCCLARSQGHPLTPSAGHL